MFNRKAERLALCGLLADIFGNPFRPVTFDVALRTPTIVALAEAACEERLLPSGELGPQRLAVLADALEEAGAADDLVAHLRCAGQHVRGCFVVGLLTGGKWGTQDRKFSRRVPGSAYTKRVGVRLATIGSREMTNVGRDPPRRPQFR